MGEPNISLLGATYSGVKGVTLPKSGGGTATFPWVEGSETKTANGTYDVTNLAELVVNVSGGSSKNAQVVQWTTRTNSSTVTAISPELTVSKTGTYDIYCTAFSTSTSSSYTYGTQLYVDGSAGGSCTASATGSTACTTST